MEHQIYHEARWTAGGLSVGGEPKEKEKKGGLSMRFPSERAWVQAGSVAQLRRLMGYGISGKLDRGQSLGFGYARGRGRVDKKGERLSHCILYLDYVLLQ